MQFTIRHQLTFNYDKPIFLEPMTILLCPAGNAQQQLLEHELQIAPEPAGRCWINDVHDNVGAVAWFNGLTDQLNLIATSRVQTLRDNPFDYLITDPAMLQLPLAPDYYPPVFSHYLQREASSEQVQKFAHDVAEKANGQTLAFLNALTQSIHEQCKLVMREYGHAMTPEQTLTQREGACRDLTMLFLDACRYLGLPARFVSGYYLIEPEEPAPTELHAWAEVYLQGAGWRGYDPSAGLAVASRHVTVATSPAPAQAMPTQGTYRGTGAQSQMSYQVDWQEIDVS